MFFIDKLNDFINTLSIIDIKGLLKLMNGIKNRKCKFTGYLSYYGGKSLDQFNGIHLGELSNEILEKKNSNFK